MKLSLTVLASRQYGTVPVVQTHLNPTVKVVSLHVP